MPIYYIKGVLMFVDCTTLYIKVITISERVRFDDGQWCSKAAAVVHNT